MKDEKQVVQQVKDTIKELQEAHKGNLKYRPYAQDISYAIKHNPDKIPLSTREVERIILENNIEIKQPVLPKKDK